jgi:hypothetical protein
VAEKNRDIIGRYGILGLFAFVWLPFWLTGPVVGCAIGFFLGLRPAVNLAVVLAGTYVATGSWALLLRAVQDRLAVYNPIGPAVLVGLVVVLAVGGHILHGARRRAFPHGRSWWPWRRRT